MLVRLSKTPNKVAALKRERMVVDLVGLIGLECALFYSAFFLFSVYVIVMSLSYTLCTTFSVEMLTSFEPKFLCQSTAVRGEGRTNHHNFLAFIISGYKP